MITDLRRETAKQVFEQEQQMQTELAKKVLPPSAAFKLLVLRPNCASLLVCPLLRFAEARGEDCGGAGAQRGAGQGAAPPQLGS